jgi:hypothetical protein
MKRQTAWNGFFKAIKECNGYEAQAKKQGNSCNIRDAWKMADLRATKYAKSLVLEHGYRDIHTAKYFG